MNTIFVWGTLTTWVNGGGRNCMTPIERVPTGELEYQGIKGELYNVSDETLQRLDDFERAFGYVKVFIPNNIVMYVMSPTHDYHYWKNIIDRS